MAVWFGIVAGSIGIRPTCYGACGIVAQFTFPIHLW
jgi:hypothetical protein